MLFFKRRGKKSGASKQPLHTLRSVVPSSWLAEYRGTVRAIGSAHYRLYCAKLTPQISAALLEEGFRGVGEISPTHSIYATHSLARDQGKTRLLFNLCLCLDSVRPIARDKAALEITAILRHSMELCTYPEYLVRKRTEHEFPWKQSSDALDEFWLIEATVAYRSVMRRFMRLGLVDDEMMTELQ